MKPNSAREAAEKIAIHLDLFISGQHLEPITAIIEETTHVGVKEEALRDIIGECPDPCSAYGITVVGIAQDALGDKPETPNKQG